jgi:hypothetical protein
MRSVIVIIFYQTILSCCNAQNSRDSTTEAFLIMKSKVLVSTL